MPHWFHIDFITTVSWVTISKGERLKVKYHQVLQLVNWLETHYSLMDDESASSCMSPAEHQNTKCHTQQVS